MERVEMMSPIPWCSDLVRPEPGLEAYAAGSKRAEKERARLMLKNLEFDEEETKAEKDKAKEVLKKPMPDESTFLYWVPESELKKELAGGGKRMKKVMVSVSKEYIDSLKSHPLPPPYEPVYIGDWMFTEAQNMVVAQQTAEREERDRILKQYEADGYAYKEYEVTDDEEEVEV